MLHIPRGFIDQVIATTQYTKNSAFVKNIVGSGGECCCMRSIDEELGTEVPDGLVQGDSVAHYGNVALLVVGGWEKGNGGVASVHLFLPSVSKWFPLQSLNISRYRHGIAVHDGIVYALGGSLAGDDSYVECFDSGQLKSPWKRLIPMCSGHIGMAATFLSVAKP